MKKTADIVNSYVDNRTIFETVLDSFNDINSPLFKEALACLNKDDQGNEYRGSIELLIQRTFIKNKFRGIYLVDGKDFQETFGDELPYYFDAGLNVLLINRNSEEYNIDKINLVANGIINVFKYYELKDKEILIKRL